MSTPDSIVQPLDYVKRAKELGHSTLCTTEHGYAGNVYEYHDLAAEHNLKLIFGVEYYYVNDRHEKDRLNTHLMILAKNNEGKRELTKLISESNLTGYYYKPRIDKQLVLSLSPENVLVTSTCVMSYVGKAEDYEENFIIPFRNHFAENFLLEIHDNAHIMQVEYNRKILELHNKYHIPLIHACDSHYIYPSQDKDRTQFLNGKNIYYPEEEGFILDYPDSDTIFARYEEQGVFTKEQVKQSLENTLLLDYFEDIKMDKEIKMPTIYPNKSHEEKMKILKDIITKEWKKDKQEIPKQKYPQYLDAIRFETQIIDDTHMEDYFLNNYEIIKRAKEKGGVLTRTGRGSAPSYYVNKLLGFTEIDRLDAPITLYPTRFISTSRILETKSLPDIDFNTSSPEPFIEAAKEILGDDNVYYMVAYGTMQASEAFRNYCRAINLKMEEYNEVGKNLDTYKDQRKWKDVIKESEKFIDVIDSVSPHPCAFLLYSKPISEDIGVLRVGNKDKLTYCALIDSGTSDSWKYLKNDFLTVTVWQLISETFKMIGKPILSIRELTKAVEDDPRIWELYEKGLTATLNQTGTDSGTPQIMQYKPKSIRELSAWVSAIRPSFASMKNVFLNRQPFSYGIDVFDQLLQTSDNFILYQEDIMKTLVYAGFPEDETYGLLKAIAKKKEGIIEPIQDRFIEGFVSKTGSEENAEKVWKIIEDAVGYGFNSSHAFSVALDSVYGAYLKVNYPLEYFTVILNNYEDDTDTTSKIQKELQHFGIKIKPIKFRQSRGHYSPNKSDNSIVKGIKSVKFLNEKIADELYDLGKLDYPDFVSLLVTIVEQTSVNSRQLEILIKLNFFEEFGGNLELFKIYEEFLNGEMPYKKTHKQATKDKRIEYIKQREIEIRETLKEKTISPPDLVMYQYSLLGYADLVIPNMKENWHVVVNIDIKASPKLSLYDLKTGEEKLYKMSKKTFNTKDDLTQVEAGSMIKLTGVEMRNKSKPDGQGGWLQLPEKEPWINSYIKYINKNENGDKHADAIKS